MCYIIQSDVVVFFYTDVAAKYSDPDFVHRASIKRQREQELNRVRVELKDLAYKLNLNPMNYISEGKKNLNRIHSLLLFFIMFHKLSAWKFLSSSNNPMILWEWWSCSWLWLSGCVHLEGKSHYNLSIKYRDHASTERFYFKEEQTCNRNKKPKTHTDIT